MYGHLLEEDAVAAASTLHHCCRSHRNECYGYQEREYQSRYDGETYVLSQQLDHGLIREYKRQEHRYRGERR